MGIGQSNVRDTDSLRHNGGSDVRSRRSSDTEDEAYFKSSSMKQGVGEEIEEVDILVDMRQVAPFHLEVGNPDQSSRKLKIIIISDTHRRHSQLKLPEGDMLIHCGDFSKFHSGKADLEEFNRWLGTLNYKTKIVVGGNHDKGLSLDPVDNQQKLSNCTYLQDSYVDVEGLRIYGAPWIPARNIFYRANQFQSSKGREKWQNLPPKIDILVTHCPPKNILDTSMRGPLGCLHIRDAVQRVKPRLHAFGHCHECTGILVTPSTAFVNAACGIVVVDYYYSDRKEGE